MRKAFATWATEKFATRKTSIFLTGDLGFRALEDVTRAMGRRFINAGVAEQNMISMAAAMAREGLEPLCYSIAPFAVFRPAEQIRLDVCLHKLNVKIVGNGGGYGYGIMGASHHAIEDIAVLSSFQGLKCFIPFCDEDVDTVCEAMMDYEGPSYLRLGAGALPPGLPLPGYTPMRRICEGSGMTVVSMGPVVLEVIAALGAARGGADVFIASELPLDLLSDEFLNSVRRTQKLLIVEEHVERGGLGEHISLKLLKAGLAPVVKHAFAKGYPSQRYGSQAYHRAESLIDRASLETSLKELNS